MITNTPDGLLCQDDSKRRETVRQSQLNGLDYVEVDCTQTQLTVNFLGRVPDWITPAHLRIEGGRRIRDIHVTRVVIQHSENEDLDDQLIVTVDKPGDFSTYRLCVIDLDDSGQPTGHAPADVDVRYTCVCFSFKPDCPADMDCASTTTCPPEPLPQPAIDYLAKDYASFRRILLDRMALLMPDWTERHVPDIGITLIELLAYVGDNLSYEQDAVATEAYLGTARQRISIRRHARLVDYRLHEGCNARNWLACEISDPILTLQASDFYAITRHPDRDGPLLKEADLPLLDPAPFLAFEPRLPAGQSGITLRQARNRIRFYDWDEASCCIPKGSTSATLVDPGQIPAPTPAPPPTNDECCDPDPPPPIDIPGGVASGKWHQLQLQPCDILVFEEVLGPRTGNPADADPTHRHAVRLTSATPTWDPLTKQLLYDVTWCDEDALPFPLCLSATSDAPDCKVLVDVSVAWGNVLLVDHGQRVHDDLGAVPIADSAVNCEDACHPAEVVHQSGRYRPRLSRLDISFATPLPACPDTAQAHECGNCGHTAASTLLTQDVLVALPEITLKSRALNTHPDAPPRRWQPRLDLLDSGPNDRHFVVEVDDQRVAWLRFGDGECGCAPEAGEAFSATYRIGNGRKGLVGAEALTQLVFRDKLPDGSGLRVRNPIAAQGGTDPEDTATARLRIPQAFKRQLERAVTPSDYADIVMRDFASQVQRAAAVMRATGVVTIIQVAIDALGRATPTPALLRCIQAHLQCVRRIGHEVHVVAAKSVPLDVVLHVCVKPGYLRAHVKLALLEVLGSGRTGPQQAPAFFHPDALALGESIALSKLVATAQAVEGVAGVVPLRLQRLFEGDEGELDQGWLPIGPLEVARLDNDPNMPENGRLTLELEGGR